MRKRHIPAHSKKQYVSIVLLPTKRTFWISSVTYIAAFIISQIASTYLYVRLLFIAFGVFFLLGAWLSFGFGFFYFHLHNLEYFEEVIEFIMSYSSCLLVNIMTTQKSVLERCRLKKCAPMLIHNLELGITACHDIEPLILLLIINSVATFVCLKVDKYEKSFPRADLVKSLLVPLPVLFIIFSVGAFVGSIVDLHSSITSLSKPVSLLTGMLCVDYSCKLVQYQMTRKSDYLEKRFHVSQKN